MQFERAVDANDEFDRHLKRMNLDQYVNVFGPESGLIPDVLDDRDLELIFDTIINERLEVGQNEVHIAEDDIQPSNLNSLSFEEFKKSFIRIASLCKVTLSKLKI